MRPAWDITGFRDEIQSVQHTTSGAASIVRLDYGYNKVHDRLYERFGASGSTGDGFAYDKIRRLTTAWMGSATSLAWMSSISFEDGGQASYHALNYSISSEGERKY